MESLLLPASIVGCSVSVLFALSTFVVLGCYREKTRPLLIKQQLALSLAFTYVVVLSGLQGYENKAVCRSVTIMIHYGVLASFLWIFVDIYHTSVCVKRKHFPNSFLRVMLFIWGIPLIFLIMAIIIGLTIKNNFSTRSKFYTCWKSDHLIWTLVFPCLAVFIISCIYLIKSSNSVFSRRKTNPSQKERRSIQAIKYSIKTNAVMLLLTVIIWIFACEIFWYNKDVKYQLVFGLTVGVQGLFLFFFYCVFCLEHDLYVSDYIVDDFSSHFYDEVEYSHGEYQEPATKETQESLTEDKNLNNVRSNFVHEESFKIIETDPDSIPRLVSEANLNNRIDCTAKTTVLIHTPEKTVQSIEKEETKNIEKEEKINEYENTNNELRNNVGDKNHDNGMLLNSVKEEKQIKDANNNNNSVNTDIKETELEQTNNASNDKNDDIIKRKEEKKTFIKANTNEKYKRNSYTGSEFSLGDDLAPRPRLGSSTSPVPRQTRSSSRSSQSSYASTMGLNELECLFNNPDLMKQSLANRNRLRNNQDDSKKKDSQRQNKQSQPQSKISNTSTTSFTTTQEKTHESLNEEATEKNDKDNFKECTEQPFSAADEKSNKDSEVQTKDIPKNDDVHRSENDKNP